MKKILFISGCLLFYFPAISQLTATFAPSADNTIYQENNNSNGAGANIFVGSTNNDYLRRSLVAFNINLPAGASVQSVTLTLVCNRTTTGATSVSLRKLTSSWGEGTSDALNNEGTGAAPATNDATWNYRFFNTSAWATPGGDFVSALSATTVVDGIGTYTWSSPAMLSDVRSWLANTSSNYGWILSGDEAGTHTSKRFASKENTNITSRPQLTITYTSALPVSLLSFDGRQVQQGIQLEWETAYEQDNSYFELDHSFDGISYKEVSRIAASVSSTEKKHYEYLDQQQQPGNHFYRLSQVDVDGNYTYAPIVQIVLTNQMNRIAIFPNPATDQINFDNIGLQPGDKYLLMNSAGLLMKSSVIVTGKVNISDLPKGAYILKIVSNSGAFQSWFVKQ